jgi:uncharacterized membrane protein
MLHSTVLKKIGSAVFIFGAILIVAMVACLWMLPDQAVAWAYLTTAGVYFVVAGVIVWLIGAAKEYKERNSDALTMYTDSGVSDGDD